LRKPEANQPEYAFLQDFYIPENAEAAQDAQLHASIARIVRNDLCYFPDKKLWLMAILANFAE